MQRRLVVDGDLLAGFNIAQREEEDVVVKNLHVSIRFARMVYVVRTIPTAAAVKTPAIIDRTDTQPSPAGTAVSFRIGNSLTRVFSYFASAGEGGNSKTSLALNSRFFDR